MKSKKVIIGLIIFGLLSFAILAKTPVSSQLFTNLLPQRLATQSYQEILATEISPGISPDYNFPVSFQYLNGCVAFAINNILIYKYDEGLDLLELEKTIDKPREVLWNSKYINALTEAYDIDYQRYRNSEKFYSFLEAGEPVTISYKLELGNDKSILHRVAAYSFDQEGIWISDSMKGKRIRIPNSEIFDESGRLLQYYFATVSRNSS